GLRIGGAEPRRDRELVPGPGCIRPRSLERVDQPGDETGGLRSSGDRRRRGEPGRRLRPGEVGPRAGDQTATNEGTGDGDEGADDDPAAQVAAVAFEAELLGDR